MKVELTLAAADMVGESVVWDELHGRLVWIDILGRRVHALQPRTGKHQIWPLTNRPTSLGLRRDGGAILADQHDLSFWEWEGEPVKLCPVEPELPLNRLNEGAVGPDGCYWVGSMLNNLGDDGSPRDISEAAGRIYRYTPDGQISRVTEDIFGITNTLVWPSPDRLITADTLANTIYAYPVGPDGQLGQREVFCHGLARGLPDGSCLDREGFLWTARVAGGACLARTAPDGQLDRLVELPCSWPTSVTFGGPNLDHLYVTSARFTMSAAHLAAHPEEGGLFSLRPGVKGLPTHRFG